MAGLQPAHINSAPHATVGRMLKRQYHFRTQFILDSKRVRGCEAGLQKHTQVTSNEWSSFSSPSFRRQPAIKGRSKDSGASSFSEFMSIDACVSLPSRRCHQRREEAPRLCCTPRWHPRPTSRPLGPVLLLLRPAHYGPHREDSNHQGRSPHFHTFTPPLDPK